MAVPKYIKDQATNPVGRPLKYKTVPELEAAISEYFDFCDNKTKEIHSEKLGDMIVADPQPYTMSGLAYALGMDRISLVNYSHRAQFFNTVKDARARVEADIDRRMSHKDTFTPGLIFTAKNNFGWKDQTQTDVTSGGEKLELPAVYLPKRHGKIEDDDTQLQDMQ